jgi:hypothetical protein
MGTLSDHAVRKLIEALRYKPKGRGLDFFIDVILLVAQWLCGRLSLGQR